jgi:hypothetical protein
MTLSIGSFESVAIEVSEDHAKLTQQYLEKFHRRFFTADANVIHIATRRAKTPDASGTARPHEGSSQPVVIPPSQGVEIVKPRRAQKRQPVATLDEEALKTYRQKVRVLASDGGSAERRALFLSATGQFFPNAGLCIKDMTHCIRIATQKPMQILEIYQDVCSEIVNKRHALIPDIQNSNKWRNILQAVQVELLRMPCMTLRGSLKVVLAHLAFAKQRMDSCADPLAKVCLMLLPIGVLLALISSDERNERKQWRGLLLCSRKYSLCFSTLLA